MEEERTITLDLGSSPDPLIDPVLSPPMVPMSHIKTKSPAAQRLYTVLAPSPRKQTFELDVGNELSPQRLRVTVEAEDDGTRNTSRRLFQSPTPKRRLAQRRDTVVTTTTVPLRGLSDDEGVGATPKRRGRPRRSGTPITTRRKRPGTPARSRKSGAHVLGPPEKTKIPSDTGVDTALDTASRPTTQPRRGAKRKSMSPVKGDGAPGSQARKRGRPRKQTIAAVDIARFEQGPMRDHSAWNNAPVHEIQQGETQPADEVEEDIWLMTMSDQPTPDVRRHPETHEEVPANERRPAPEPEPSRPETDQHHYDWPDMASGADSFSDAESLPSENRGDYDGEDTVMAGEEFTMISIGSLPSMQPNSSVMAPARRDDEFGEATSLIINGALEYLRQSQNNAAEEVANAEPGTAKQAQPAAAERAEENPPQQHQEPQLPPRARSPRLWNQSPRRPGAQPLSRQLAEKTLQQADRQSPAPKQPTIIEAEHHETSAYNDSFSEIPEAVLTAATPGRYHQPQPPAEEPSSGDIQPSIERPSTTPSPVLSDTEDRDAPTKPPSRLATDAEMRSSPPIANPSPQQRSTSFMPHYTRRNSTETPADQLSSFASSNAPVRDAQPQLPVHLPVPDQQPRPSLSPIVRAGRALQLITSDPPSPPARGSVLGSPFRGSVPKSSQSPAPVPPEAPATRSLSQPGGNGVTQSPQRSWLAPFSQMKDFIVRSAQSLSPSRVSVSGTERMEDPFGPDPDERPGSRSTRTTLFSGAARQAVDRDATISLASSTGANSVHEEEDERISWQDEMEGRTAGPQRTASPDLGDVDARAFASAGAGADRGWRGHYQRSANESDMEVEAEAPGPQAVLGQEEEAHKEEQEHEQVPEQLEGQEEDEEEDIWAIEAQRPTPYAQKIGPARREPVLESPPRSKISSSWRQDRHLTHSDEVSNEDAFRNSQALNREEEGIDLLARRKQVERVPVRFERAVPTMTEDEEFSMLSQVREKQALVPAKPPVPKKSDLSAFFSSPATVPDMQEAPGFGLPQANQVVPKPRTAPTQRPQWDGNGFFSQYLREHAQKQLPLKHLEISCSQRNTNLFSGRKAADKGEMTREDSQVRPRSLSPEREEEENVAPAHISQKTNFKSFQRPFENTGRVASSAARSESPEESREQTAPAHISQKNMNFRPRQRPFGNIESAAQPRRFASPQDREEATRPARITQKMGFEPRQGPFGETAGETARATADAGGTTSPDSPEEEARSAPIPENMNFEPRQRPFGTTNGAPTARQRTISPESPEQEARLPRIPQKMNFTPRRREPSNALFQPKPVDPANPLFGNSQVSAFFSPSRARTQRPIRRQEEDYEEEESSFIPPPLKPLPDRAVSPGKSSFRSPLKPKTPGRVVDFTSSTLSPQAQAQARAERRASMSPEKQRDHRSQRTGRSSSSTGGKVVEEDKENQSSESPEPEPVPRSRPRFEARLERADGEEEQQEEEQRPPTLSSLTYNLFNSLTRLTRPIITTAVSSSTIPPNTVQSTTIQQPQSAHEQPQSQSQAQPQPLSTKEWARPHWLRLDELLQARKKGIPHFRREVARGASTSSFPPQYNTRQRSGGGSRHLLGKIVESPGDGESMVLEEWHLDVVDAFMTELGLGPVGPGGRRGMRRGGRRGGQGGGEGGGGEEWDEVAIAKRVFALLVGEERRRRLRKESEQARGEMRG
ncbi:hypothetical protein VTI74DRAFT_2106 [Chaetomium olivicolor]